MRENIINIISKLTGIDSEYLNVHSADIRQWDSMKHIEILLLLEEEYDIRFDEDEIAELNSVDAICNNVERMV